VRPSRAGQTDRGFASRFEPDRLYFISRPNRVHCDNIRTRGRVAGAILAIELQDLGQAVRGVTFTGTAAELPTEGVDAQIATYVGRWPTVAGAIDPVRLAAGQTHHRLYEITVASWILYDEERFQADPRQPVPARRPTVHCRRSWIRTWTAAPATWAGSDPALSAHRTYPRSSAVVRRRPDR
jgi:hypothetical protein